MFMISMRLSKKKIITFLVVCVSIFSLVYLLLSSKDSIEPTSSDVTQQTIKISSKAKDNESRVVFLQSFGWEVSSEPIENTEVKIPEEFDDVFNTYNEIQKLQNMNLEKFAGKRVKRYTYLVLNYPNKETEVRANLLIYKDKIVGGDICSVELDGFMHGFEIGETQTNTMINDIEKEVAVTSENTIEASDFDQDGTGTDEVFNNTTSLDQLIQGVFSNKETE